VNTLDSGPASASTRPPTLLCVSNFPSNTGYAWDFIESIYAGVADRLAPRGVRTIVAYPKLESEPRSLTGSSATAVEFDLRLDTVGRASRSLRFMRANNIKAIYLTDRAASSLSYALLRLAGVKSIVVHDHTSGERPVLHPVFRTIKRLFVRLPGVGADSVITVSDYVARRLVRTAGAPPSRIKRIWNGIPVRAVSNAQRQLRKLIGVDDERTLIVCSCRAHAVKGVAYLLRAFDRVVKNLPRTVVRPILIYIGDGPQRAELEEMRDALDSHNDIVFLGYRPDAAALLAGADICVVPSVWQDAFPLGVLEAMAAGKPVIGTSVGGIPEMVEDGVTGLLVPPADEKALAIALDSLITKPELAQRFGRAGLQRVEERFRPEQQLDAVSEIVGRSFSP
jgi:glycosyltransferase involved in cell wall biosynthesis